MQAGYFCKINEGSSFGLQRTTNISSPGWFLGSTGFHGMASLVVKVPWVAPACAPAAGVAPVPRCCATDCVAFVFITAPCFNLEVELVDIVLREPERIPQHDHVLQHERTLGGDVLERCDRVALAPPSCRHHGPRPTVHQGARQT